MRTAIVCVSAVLALGLLRPDLAAQPQKEGKTSSPHEEVVKDMLGTIEGILKVLATIQDEPSANAARPELKKAALRLQELRKRAADLKQPTKEEKQRLEKAYQGKMDEALKKLRGETIRVRGIPGGAEAVQEIAVAVSKDGKDKGKKEKQDKK
ncbi:MAG: hypothetical protein L0Z62_06020 [Gemmataceae bacterium]|nr:hypothetical protein [Gemmataceae bacterium]